MVSTPFAVFDVKIRSLPVLIIKRKVSKGKRVLHLGNGLTNSAHQPAMFSKTKPKEFLCGIKNRFIIVWEDFVNPKTQARRPYTFYAAEHSQHRHYRARRPRQNDIG
jgi:hypothetical protein